VILMDMTGQVHFANPAVKEVFVTLLKR